MPTIYLTVDKDGSETVFEPAYSDYSSTTEIPPFKLGSNWASYGECILLPKGTIKKILGYELTWKDDYIKLI